MSLNRSLIWPSIRERTRTESKRRLESLGSWILEDTTVQSILDRLEKRGLVNVTTRRSRHVYHPNDPSVLKKILEQRIKDLGNIMPLLKKIKADESVDAKIKIYYRERMAEIFHEALSIIAQDYSFMTLEKMRESL